jgi:4-hydroxybenzoyl-CoA thioesterase
MPSSFGDVVIVESWVTNWGTSSFSVEHKLYRGDMLAVEGFEKRVWTGHVPGQLTRGKSKPIPKEVMEQFE